MLNNIHESCDLSEVNYHENNQQKIHGLAQDCSSSSALALELLQSCTKPSKRYKKRTNVQISHLLFDTLFRSTHRGHGVTGLILPGSERRQLVFVIRPHISQLTQRLETSLYGHLSFVERFRGNITFFSANGCMAEILQAVCGDVQFTDLWHLYFGCLDQSLQGTKRMSIMPFLLHKNK